LEVQSAVVDAVDFLVCEGIFYQYIVHNMLIILSLNLQDLVVIAFDFSINFLQETPKQVEPSHFQMWQGCGSIGKNQLACSCGQLGPGHCNRCANILGIA
jgi:hypothetical protein